MQQTKKKHKFCRIRIRPGVRHPSVFKTQSAGHARLAGCFFTSSQFPPAYLSVAQLQVVQALRVRLLADVGLVHDEVLASSLLRQQHARVVPSQLWRSRERVMHTAPSRRG
ncbi:hypothetical protein EYF80_048219 [Liparis tanakae]|uniref:Uncharacterized protein n=1 Tax=Liparis tanakae TaxID=230148 RepID=A0A4Z2FLE7_9TELE|nr:hypothetical protein EYF80_048219 [Liparis tanakae]